jgi:hypothetical protein
VSLAAASIRAESGAAYHVGMQIFRRGLAGALLVMLIAGVSPAAAHDEFRFVGTLTAANVAKNVVTMKFKEEGKDVTVNLKLTTRTLITRDKQKVAKTELKAGLSVVVDALGDDYDDLEALEIKIVPPPAK